MRPSEYVQQGWTQRASARDRAGNPRAVNDEFACSWCAVGAIVAANLDDPDAIDAAFKRLSKALGAEHGKDWLSVSEWNDDPERTQEEVVQVLQECGL